jgi:hypothetical protein
LSLSAIEPWRWSMLYVPICDGTNKVEKLKLKVYDEIKGGMLEWSHQWAQRPTGPLGLAPPIGNGGADASNNPMLQASEIFEALREIPNYGLGPDEVKAYRILSNDNGRRLTSLLRLPKNIRKNWLLMEIKASRGWWSIDLSALCALFVPVVRRYGFFVSKSGIAVLLCDIFSC